ncbi:DNA-directed RNA polymerase subunit beta [Listeria phage LPJP1]|nr:DNA-directed RNA polymerase subunit beta [Listeria phage LPJP1]
MDLTEINDEKYKGKFDFLAETLLIPNLDKTNSNRSQMFTSHLSQNIQLEQADPPLVFTGFENQVGKYSTGYKKLDGRWKLLKKFYKNKFNYTAILFNEEEELYHIVERKEAKHLTEHFGLKFNNEVIDNINENEEFENKVIYRDQNYDEDMNFQYGKNLNAVYIPYKGFTNEDSIVVSESTAQKMASYLIKKVKINLNTNDVLLNLYGDDESYRTFPSIGEEIKDGKLMGIRRINYNDMGFSMKDVNLRKIFATDTVKHAEGIVIDIDIYNNESLDKLRSQKYNHQMYNEYISISKYYSEVVEYLKPIVSSKRNNISSDLSAFYNKIAAFNDPANKFQSEGRVFDRIVAVFTILERIPLVKGSKLTGRYGNKGIIGLILPDEEMPVIETIDGEEFDKDSCLENRADIILNPFGVNNRLNPSQSFEHTFNMMSQVIRYRMEHMDSREEKFNLLSEYIKSIDENMYKSLISIYDQLSDSDKDHYLEDTIKNGIYIQFTPFWNDMDIFKLKDIRDKFNIDRYKLSGISKPIEMGQLYMLRLKHEPIEKTSIRSEGNTNFQNLPTKTKDMKNSDNVTNNTPIRVGKFCRII